MLRIAPYTAFAAVVVIALLATSTEARAKPTWEEYADQIGAPRGDASKVGRCSKANGPAAYQRCLRYLSMAGTPQQRDYAKKAMNMRRTCRYSQVHRERVCTDSTAIRGH
jgi:hypothetical protein